MSDMKRPAPRESKAPKKRTKTKKSEELEQSLEKEEMPNIEVTPDVQNEVIDQADPILAVEEQPLDSLPAFDEPKRFAFVPRSRNEFSPDLGDDYTIQFGFDKAANRFTAFVVEIPEVSESGTDRAKLIEEVVEKLRDHILMAQKRGESVPEPIQTKQYPEKLEVSISQGLYRKLDLLSRLEKVSLDAAVTELLATALEKRSESGGRRDDRRPQPQQDRGGQHGHQRHQHHRHGGGQGNQRGGRNFNNNMDSRENFMEYVRNLEKGKFRK